MIIGDIVWYNTGDLITPPRKAKILRLLSKTPADTEYVCKDMTEGYRVVLKAEGMFTHLQLAKDAKIGSINQTMDILSKNIADIQSFSGEDILPV